MGGKIIEGDGESEGGLGGLEVFGRGLLSEKARREQKEYQTYTFHGAAIINQARYGSKVGVQRNLKIERALVRPHPVNEVGGMVPTRGTRRTSGGACLEAHFRRNSFL